MTDERNRRELPFDPAWGAWERFGEHQPATPIEAMMLSDDGEPEESLVEKLARLEHVKDAIEALPPRHRWIIEALFYRGVSLRELGRELSLSKTHVARLRDEAFDLLREALS